MIQLKAGGATDVGRVRSSNQDSMLVDDELRLYAVADGVGGHQGGEVASLTAVETLRATYDERTVDGLVHAVRWANRTVWKKAEEESTLRGMGTTLCALALVEEDGEQELGLVNVGDSRAYLLRDGELSQLTEDHSLVAELEREGKLSADEARDHPQRSLITRALGLEPDVEVDNWQLVPYRGDRVLLCTDGLTNEVRDERIASTLRRLADPGEAARDLIHQANANGGSDNITVVIVDVVNDEDRAGRASAAVAADGSTRGGGQTSVLVDEEGARVAAPPAPASPDAEAEAEAPPVAAGKAPSTRRGVTLRLAVFTVVLLAVLGVAVAAVGWYARGSYFVAFAGDRVAVFKGRPGGLLWFDPTLEQRTGLARADVPPSRVDDVQAGKEVASLADAHRYIGNLQAEAAATPRADQATTPTNATPSSTVVLGTSTSR